MDVAAVFEALLETNTIQNRLRMAAEGDIPTSALVGWAYLHDIGKLAPEFQAKGWEKGTYRHPTRSHLDCGWQWLKSRGRPPFLPWIRPCNDWCDALMAHHGVPIEVSSRELNWQTFEHYDWKVAEKQVLTGLQEWCSNFRGDLPERPRLVHLAAGLLSLADWIGSDSDQFKFVEKFDPEYGERARERAALALSKIGIAVEGWRPETAPSFKELTGYSKPNPSQDAVAGIGTEEQLVILEAETGSGKTEAAIWRFSQLFAEGRVDGLYFALPTRAAASQLQNRISGLLRNWFDAPPGVTLAVPGQLRVDGAKGYRLPGWKVRWDEDVSHQWAAEHATRYLAAPVAVGTVDQAMMAALSVKHAPMRAASLSRSLLVIDEVHASDPYMAHIIQQLLKDHIALGGYAMLMSATLGSSARVRWLGQDQIDRQTADRCPYPAVWTKSGAVATNQGKTKTISLRINYTMDSVPLAECAIDAAENGARVLIIRNTVSEAQAVWQRIGESHSDLLLGINNGPALHHARFAAEDRLCLDAAVEAALGKGAASQGVIVIGTQTLEQALDIDADILLTDLCPMDVLLQRLGRLHRHDRARPTGFETPHAIVLLPGKDLNHLAAPAFQNGLGAWDDGGIQGIYTDLPGLEATRRMIESCPNWSIPAMSRSLVEAATHHESLDEIVEELGWKNYDQSIMAKEIAERQQGSYVAYSKGCSFTRSFKPFRDDVALRTRLGGEGPIYDLPDDTIGPFGTKIRRIALPAHWSRGLTGSETASIENNMLLVDDHAFTYQREGLSKVPT